MSDHEPRPGFWHRVRNNRWLHIATHPATRLSLATLTLGGFVAGVAFWGAFNTALEFANTESFCITCHEMRDNVYQELQGTVHWSNAAGVRATCPDCHVPHAWTLKIARKMAASREVWGHVFGIISTRQKFLDTRLALAQHEWARMTANRSQECRNCHNPLSMDLSRQSETAARVHKAELLTGQKTCIDCHKGIAHHLPGVEEIQGFD